MLTEHVLTFRVGACANDIAWRFTFPSIAGSSDCAYPYWPSQRSTWLAMHSLLILQPVSTIYSAVHQNVNIVRSFLQVHCQRGLPALECTILPR